MNYWEEQKLAAAVVEKLRQGPYLFGVATEWHARLLELGITAERHIRIASEGALLGSLIAHGVSSEWGSSATERDNSTSWSTSPAGFMRNGL